MAPGTDYTKYPCSVVYNHKSTAVCTIGSRSPKRGRTWSSDMKTCINVVKAYLGPGQSSLSSTGWDVRPWLPSQLLFVAVSFRITKQENMSNYIYYMVFIEKHGAQWTLRGCWCRLCSVSLPVFHLLGVNGCGPVWVDEGTCAGQIGVAPLCTRSQKRTPCWLLECKMSLFVFSLYWGKKVKKPLPPPVEPESFNQPLKM